MAKYFGEVGYRTTIETEPDVWDEEIVTRKYYGDTIKNYIRMSFGDFNTTIKTPQCNNSISIVADPYAFENFHNIVYATFMGTKWTVTSADVQYPRLVLTLGGVYNDEQTDS